MLDVRTDDEWRAGHLPGALHIMGGYLNERLGEVPRDRPLVVMCGSGYRSTIAASVLERGGFTEITNLTGGMKAWTDAGLETTRDTARRGDDRRESTMTPEWLAGLALTGLVGASLGLLGAGGSIIMLPVLVYVVGVEPHAAVPLSLAIVGTTSLVSVAVHSNGGEIRWGTALLSGAPRLEGPTLVAGSPHSSPVRCYCCRSACCWSWSAFGCGVRPTRTNNVTTTPQRPSLMLAAGSFVGLLTGFLGVGGGFLIVPALVKVGGLGMCQAIRTSLVVIAMSSVAGRAPRWLGGCH